MADVGELNRAGQEQDETDRVGRRVCVGRLDRLAERDAIATSVGHERGNGSDIAVHHVVKVRDVNVG